MNETDVPQTIELPSAALDLTAACMFVAQQLKEKGRPDIAAVLVRNELNERLDKKTKRKRKQVLYSPRGKKIELDRDVVQQMQEEQPE